MCSNFYFAQFACTMVSWQHYFMKFLRENQSIEATYKSIMGDMNQRALLDGPSYRES